MFLKNYKQLLIWLIPKLLWDKGCIAVPSPSVLFFLFFFLCLLQNRSGLSHFSFNFFNIPHVSSILQNTFLTIPNPLTTHSYLSHSSFYNTSSISYTQILRGNDIGRGHLPSPHSTNDASISSGERIISTVQYLSESSLRIIAPASTPAM